MQETKSLNFGHVWTEKKLIAVEKYLCSYLTAMKNKPFQLCYIDAFAGNGHVTLKDGTKITGSALRTLKYDFHKFYFFEQNQDNADTLLKEIQQRFPEKVDKVSIIVNDCNEMLRIIHNSQWYEKYWRGVAFLDPYAMDLEWDSLKAIAQTEAFVVWYFFPMMATNRNLYKDVERIPAANRAILTKIFGEDNWETEIYKESDQLTLFGTHKEKTDSEGLKNYLLSRLEQIFSYVSKDACIMKNEKNAPVFLLCFAISSKNQAAIKLARNIADHILKHIEEDEHATKIKN